MGVCQARRPRQAGDATAAAETEDRQPFHRRLELEAIEQFGVEAGVWTSPVIVLVTRMSMASSSTPADAVALSVTSAKKIERIFLEYGGAFFPGVRLEDTT